MSTYGGKPVKEGGGFSLLEPGEYTVRIENVEVKTTPNNNKCWRVKFSTKIGRDTKIFYDNLYWTEKASWRLEHFLKCFAVYKEDRPELTSYTPTDLQIPTPAMGVVKVVIGKPDKKGRTWNEVALDGFHTYKDKAKPKSDADETGAPIDNSDVNF